MKQISGQIDLFDYLKELETICKHSGHKCNKKELWRVADTLDELMCPHVCCRNCATKMCGARATAQRSLRQSILLRSWTYVMMHSVLSAEMALTNLSGWTARNVHPVGQGYPGSHGTGQMMRTI